MQFSNSSLHPEARWQTMVPNLRKLILRWQLKLKFDRMHRKLKNYQPLKMIAAVIRWFSPAFLRRHLPSHHPVPPASSLARSLPCHQQQPWLQRARGSCAPLPSSMAILQTVCVQRSQKSEHKKSTTATTTQISTKDFLRIQEPTNTRCNETNGRVTRTLPLRFSRFFRQPAQFIREDDADRFFQREHSFLHPKQRKIYNNLSPWSRKIPKTGSENLPEEAHSACLPWCHGPSTPFNQKRNPSKPQTKSI